MTAIFLSDVHLRDVSSVKAKLVIRFLQEVASQYRKIFILGDLFDVWPGTSTYLVRSFRPVILVLKRLVEQGHSVHYIEGNHDFYLGQYFTEHLGIEVHPDWYSERWNGQHIYMTHGDLGNPREIGYRALRYLLRRQTLQMALRAVPSEWVFKTGLRSSQLSRKYQQKVPKAEVAIRQIWRETAEDIFRKGYDVVIMGHTHIPDDFSTTIGGRPCRYFNTGDWVRHFTYLEFDGSHFYTKTHPVKDL